MSILCPEFEVLGFVVPPSTEEEAASDDGEHADPEDDWDFSRLLDVDDASPRVVALLAAG